MIDGLACIVSITAAEVLDPPALLPELLLEVAVLLLELFCVDGGGGARASMMISEPISARP